MIRLFIAPIVALLVAAGLGALSPQVDTHLPLVINGQADQETPTVTATPEVVAPACPDPRAVIISPGVGQVVSGEVNVLGTATHEHFQFYKLEYAPGANATGGFTYFAGGQVQINGGVLGNIDTTVLPNGEYTIRLTVVDQVGNFPPPCDVTVVVQN